MPISQDMKDKIALFCDIDPKAVIEAGDADTLYSIPLDLQKQGLDSLVCSHLKLDCREADMEEWKELVKKVKSLSKTVNVFTNQSDCHRFGQTFYLFDKFFPFFHIGFSAIQLQVAAD